MVGLTLFICESAKRRVIFYSAEFMRGWMVQQSPWRIPCVVVELRCPRLNHKNSPKYFGECDAPFAAWNGLIRFGMSPLASCEVWWRFFIFDKHDTSRRASKKRAKESEAENLSPGSFTNDPQKYPTYLCREIEGTTKERIPKVWEVRSSISSVYKRKSNNARAVMQFS